MNDRLTDLQAEALGVAELQRRLWAATDTLTTERALADDLADVLTSVVYINEVAEAREIERVLARYRETRQR